nr:hypothetical protein [uncultured Butyrivibrio sp.]
MKLKLPANFIRKMTAITLVAAIIAIVLGGSIKSRALFDPDQAINYQLFASKVAVENSVLFIGTYIIHKDALTEDLYQKAVDSASESGQSNIYYKSELSDGQWFETGDIDNGVKGISIDGLPVSIDTINPLYVTYYVGKDGILKDAKTLAAINPFDIPDPYNLASLPELDPIRAQYTSSSSATSISQEDFLKNKNSADSGNLRSDVYTYQLISTFFSLNLRDDQTNQLDQQLNNLNNTYIALKGAGQDDEAKLVYDLMEKIDATRRAIVMEKLSELDENLLNALYELANGSLYTPYGSFKTSSSSNSNVQTMMNSVDHISTTPISSLLNSWFGLLGVQTSSGGDWWGVLDSADTDRQKRAEEANQDNEDYVYDKTPQEHPFAADSALLESIGTAISNCGASYTKYMSKALVDSDDILGHYIYDYSTQVIAQSGSGSLGGPVTLLKHVTNIRDNQIVDKAGELELLRSSLLSAGSAKYTAAATAGTNSGYSSLSSEGAKKSSLENQKTDEEALRTTFQFLIESMRLRDKPANALEYVNERIKITNNLLNEIPSDEFKTYSTSSVQAHIVWLKEEAQKIIDSDKSLRSKLDELKAKKEELQKKRDQCLDNNDLAGAKAYDAKIAAIDKDIELEAKANGSGDGSGDGSGSGSGDGLTSGEDSLADSLIDKALSKLADDENADLSGVAQALADIGAEDKLDALAKKAADSGASADTLAGIKDAQDSLKDKENAADANDLLAELENLFGKSLDEMDERELAVAGAVASKLSKGGIVPADELTNQISNKLMATNNRYYYRQFGSDKATEYIDMDTLSDVTPYRYFYDDSKAVATMTAGSKVYIFNRGSDEMHKQSMDSDPEDLLKQTQYQGNVYLSEDDADNYFKCIAEYLNKTEYSVCLTSTMQSQVDDYTKQLQEILQ